MATDYFSFALSNARLQAAEVQQDRTCYCHEAGYDNCRCIEPCKECGEFDDACLCTA